MKKNLLFLALGMSAMSAHAVYFLPTPQIVSETSGNGKVDIEWTYDDSDTKAHAFQVVVYKMHKATIAENFILAETDFTDIESTGTMSASEERGAVWDYVTECPGWWVKFPLYMNNALGIDCVNYFAGSDNADIFGGAYLVSPDYDLSKLTEKTLFVNAELGNEATSVTGGFAVWAWNTNWNDPKNIDYKPVYNMDCHYDDLASTSWKAIEEELTFPKAENYFDPDDVDEVNGICTNRSRVMFYGYGHSAIWINSFSIAAKMAVGDMVDYGAEIHRVEGTKFSIDTTGDTENDYVYAYEIRPMHEEFDDYRNVQTIRFTNYAYNTPRHVIGQLSGIENVTIDESDIRISTVGGEIVIAGADGLDAQIFATNGACVYHGRANGGVSLGSGVYIVKVGNKTAKVVI